MLYMKLTKNYNNLRHFSVLINFPEHMGPSIFNLANKVRKSLIVFLSPDSCTCSLF